MNSRNSVMRHETLSESSVSFLFCFCVCSLCCQLGKRVEMQTKYVFICVETDLRCHDYQLACE